MRERERDDHSAAVLHCSLAFLCQGSYSHSDAAVRNKCSGFPSRDTSNFYSHLLFLLLSLSLTHTDHPLTVSLHKSLTSIYPLPF